MKEFRLEAKLKNNLLVQRRIESGLTLQQAAEGAGITYATYLGYETMRNFPLSNNLKRWKPTALKIAIFWNVSPEKLWPAVILGVEVRSGSFVLGSAEARLLVSDYSTRMAETPNKLLEEKETIALLQKLIIEELTPREQKVVNARLGINGTPLATLDRLGEMLGVTRESIRRTEMKAFQKIRRYEMDLLGYGDSEYRYQRWKREEKRKWEEKHKKRDDLVMQGG